MLAIKPFRQTAGLCGPASLKIAMSFFGVHVSEARLTKLAGANTKDGVDAKGLVRAARALGFRARLRDLLTIEDLRKSVAKNIPVIVDWFSVSDGHYSVVVGVDKENVFLADPELGQTRAMRHQEFLHIWFDYAGYPPRNAKAFIVRSGIFLTRPKQRRQAT